ncbi:MAG: hypothetical protein ABII22_03215 [Candidatus Micrarchaeota archaeon]
MKRTILFILLLLFATLTFADAVPADPGNMVTVTTTAQSSGFEFANSWMQIALILIMLMLILASIAFMFGKAFNLPSLLAFARVEIVQILTNALIIVFIFAIITFVDVLMVGLVNDSGLPGVTCDADQYCIGVVATAYTNDLVDLIDSDINSDLGKSITAGAASAESSGLSCHKLFDPWWIPCYGFMSVGWATERYKSMDVDRYAIDLEYYNSYLSSLLAQKFFVERVIPAFAPFILFLGIITRSFFATRKLGGLLIAIALGVMFVFPLMFVFNWMSLNIMLYGDKAIGGSESNCPLECQKAFPIAYDINDPDNPKIFYTKAELRSGLVQEGVPADQLELKLENLIAGQEGNENIGTITSCNATFYASCPQLCRQLPLPTGASCWGNLESEKGCSAYPEECKLKQIIEDPVPEKVELCAREGEANPTSSFCKTILPMKSDCDIGTARFVYITKRFNEDFPDTFSIDSEPIGFNLPDSCYSDCSYDNEGVLKCPDSCTNQLRNWGYEISPYFGFRVEQTSGNCLLAKPSCRVVYRESYDANHGARGTGEKECDINARTCPASLDPYQSCVYILPKNGAQCSDCLKVEEDYQYSPAIRKTCADLCGAGMNKGKASTTGDIVKNSGSDYVGPEDVKNVSKFMIPAFVLPLMNILVTLMFIKTMSAMLGGDIEIPGLSKVL